ncbi:MbcA/ParS/Xre antitoxin family protein [Pseudomonas stutzeri]|uniref:antitoxin Xre/MbcA/ParS toxin-binding domain-containing protein n=1 Tax=Stutzerimonas stutzeri TaxID=316 RepID=UPI0009BBEA11
MDPNEIERKLLSDVQDLAEQVFEDRSLASEWMAKPNLALGGNTPVSCCASIHGTQQVRRVLWAIASGGVV